MRILTLDGDTLDRIIALSGLLIAVLAFLYSFLGISGFKTRLKNEPKIRGDAARSLTAPGPLSAYLRTLESALATLTSWMGERAQLFASDGGRGEWSRSINWCFIIAVIYPFVSLLISWLFEGSGVIGKVAFLPPPLELPVWKRASLVITILGLSFFYYFLFKHIDTIDALAGTWLGKHIWNRTSNFHQISVKTFFLVIIGTCIFSLLYFSINASRPFSLAFAGTAILVLTSPGSGTLAIAGALAALMHEGSADVA